MRSSGTLIALAATLLASSPLAEAHSDHHRRLEKRAGRGAKCGPAGGNAVCDTGLCCSEGGVCGTGGEYCSAPGCLLSFGPACDGNQNPAGADTSKTPRPKFGNVPYGVDITSCTVMGKMAITFDDGPYIYTSEILDVLKRNNVKATFFIVGNNGAKGQINDPSSGYVPIVQRMVADGHQVGSHSWSHEDLEAATPEQRRAQIINNEIAIASILGAIPTYFRPPYTSCGSACYSDLSAFGYHVVNYDVDPKDWEDGGVNAKAIYSGIVSPSSPSNSAWLTLAHDIQPFTVHEFAQYMIDMAKARGFDLVTVGECLGDPAGNWYRDPSTGAAKGGSGSAPSPPPQRTETTSSSSTAGPSSEPSSTKKSSSSSTPTPKPVPSGTDFGLGKSNSGNSTKSSTTSKSGTSSGTPSASSFISSSGTSTAAPTSSTTAAGNAGSRATVPTSPLGGNMVLGMLFGFFGLLFLP